MEMSIPDEYKTIVEREFEVDQQHEKELELMNIQEDQELQPTSYPESKLQAILSYVQNLESDERMLTVRNFLNYIWNGNEEEEELEQLQGDKHQVLENIYIPINTVTPSELEGLSLEDERKLRIFGCELIKDSSIMLKMPNIVATTAQIIFHRFYYRKSFQRFQIINVASGALFLAGKIEENPRKIKDIVSVLDYAFKKKSRSKRPVPVIDINSFVFTDLKSEIIGFERLILNELGFHVHKIQSDNAHKYLHYYLRYLGGSKQLAQKAWSFVNDCHRTVSVLCFPPNVIASACIYLAVHAIDFPLPQLEWFKIFGVKLEDIEYVSADILNLYEIGVVDGVAVQKILESHLQGGEVVAEKEQEKEEEGEEDESKENGQEKESGSKEKAVEKSEVDLQREELARKRERSLERRREEERKGRHQRHHHHRHKSHKHHRKSHKHKKKEKKHRKKRSRSDSSDSESEDSSDSDSQEKKKKSKHKK